MRTSVPTRFGANGSVDEFVRRCRTRRTPIGALLLEQSVIAGIGNVYRAELLFLCGIHPRDRELAQRRGVRSLWSETVRLLRIGVRLGRIVTRRPADLGGADHAWPTSDRLYVYKRGGDPCHRCGAPVQAVELASRTTWFCGGCQS